MTTAMIVDDSGLMRKMVRVSLELFDVTVVGESASGEEAVSLYQQCEPDVVTMDITLPGIDGTQATRRIVEQNPDAKIIVVTAMASEFVLKDAYAAGAVGYVVKPFSATQLGSELCRVLRKEVANNGSL